MWPSSSRTWWLTTGQRQMIFQQEAIIMTLRSGGSRVTQAGAKTWRRTEMKPKLVICTNRHNYSAWQPTYNAQRTWVHATTNIVPYTTRRLESIVLTGPILAHIDMRDKTKHPWLLSALVPSHTWCAVHAQCSIVLSFQVEIFVRMLPHANVGSVYFPATCHPSPGVCWESRAVHLVSNTMEKKTLTDIEMLPDFESDCSFLFIGNATT